MIHSNCRPSDPSDLEVSEDVSSLNLSVSAPPGADAEGERSPAKEKTVEEMLMSDQDYDDELEDKEEEEKDANTGVGSVERLRGGVVERVSPPPQGAELYK